MAKKVKYVCSKCGSEDVLWDIAKQKWVLDATFDYDCGSCDGECNFKEMEAGVTKMAQAAWLDAKPVEGAMNVESAMVVDLDNASPMVKLLVALLDDPHGISEAAFEAMKPVVLKNGGSKAIRQIMSQVEGVEGRVYLPEGWNE